MTPEDQIDAAELALGLLEGSDRTVALERMLADPEFAAEVAWWRPRLAALYDGYDPAEPPAALLDRLETLVESRADTPPQSVSPKRWPWLVGGGVGGALAASIAVALLMQPTRQPAPIPITRPQTGPLLVAALAPAKGERRAAVAAVVDPLTRVIRVAAIETPQGRSAELWRIGNDGVPRALGLISADRPTQLSVASSSLPLPGETLAVSIEPVGGSPTGSPTGPVVATGVLARG